MRFLADMGVDIRVVDWLRQQGHDVVHLRDQGLHRLPNGDIFEKAAVEGRVILTFDLDFGEIVALSAGRSVSVILFRLHNTRASHVMEHLRKVLEESAKSLDQGAILVVEESRHRTRRLPLGS